MDEYLRENLEEYLRDYLREYVKEEVGGWFRKNWKKLIIGALAALAAAWVLYEIIPRSTYYDVAVSGVTWDWEQAAAEGKVWVQRKEYEPGSYSEQLQWDWADVPDQPASVRITGRYYHNIFRMHDQFKGTLTFTGPDQEMAVRVSTTASYGRDGSLFFMESPQRMTTLYVSCDPETGCIRLQLAQWLDSVPGQWNYPLFASTVDRQQIKEMFTPKEP